MAEALYLNDSYLKEFDAIVIESKEIDKSNVIALDRTAFYPRGGGQPSDTGKLIVNNEEVKVIEVYKYDNEIYHVIDKPLEKGLKVKGVIDWDRRYRLMRMHTAAHLISAIIGEEGVMITGNQLGIERSRIDFNLEQLDREKIKACIDKANQLIEKGANVKVYYLPREEALKIPTISRLAKGLLDLKEFRIVEIEGIDKQADGGTHVRNIKEIGRIELLKIENKGKNNRRLYFTIKDL